MRREVTLFRFDDDKHFRAVVEGDNRWAEAWPVRRYMEAGAEVLEAVVTWPDFQGTQLHRFTWDGTNWKAPAAPIARVTALDLFV